MTKKELIESIKKMVFGEVTPVEKPVETEVKFVDVKTNDGRILRVDDIAVGSKAVEITEEGEVALEDGTYVLEDGVSLVVEAGLIKEVVEAPVEEVIDEEMSKIVEGALDKFSKMVESFEAMNLAFEAEKTEKESLKAELKAVSDKFTAMEERVNKFAAAPAEEKTEIKKKYEVSESLVEKVRKNRNS